MYWLIQGSLMEQLQTHIKQLEEEKQANCQEAGILRDKVEELKHQINTPLKDMVGNFIDFNPPSQRAANLQQMTSKKSWK